VFVSGDLMSNHYRVNVIEMSLVGWMASVCVGYCLKFLASLIPN